jgi:hypothetical protein
MKGTDEMQKMSRLENERVNRELESEIEKQDLKIFA